MGKGLVLVNGGREPIAFRALAKFDRRAMLILIGEYLSFSMSKDTPIGVGRGNTVLFETFLKMFMPNSD